MPLDKKNLRQMLAMAAASLLLGLAVNFFAAKPLPLFRPLDGAAGKAPAVQLGEVDADFVLQVRPGSATLLLDARAAAAYRLGHIPGAISLPLGEFAAAFPAMEPRLRAARMLVLYCSGPTCNDSSDLGRLLQARGLKGILLYKGGMEDWEGRGHAVGR